MEYFHNRKRVDHKHEEKRARCYQELASAGISLSKNELANLLISTEQYNIKVQVLVVSKNNKITNRKFIVLGIFFKMIV
jgi:hypothetical protein